MAIEPAPMDASHGAGSHFDSVLQELSMNPKMAKKIVFGALALLALLGACWQAQAQAAKTPYPSMAPLDQYLMTDRNAEMDLARSAAPDSISRNATILVFGRQGYKTAIEGKNGFVCIVERAWMSPSDHPEFWNPKLRGPICFNPAAARSILPLTIKRTEWVLAGLSKAQIMDNLKAAQLIEKNCPLWNPER
jgi:hypothetical protein